MNVSIKAWRFDKRFWLFFSLISLSILYLNLIWKATADLDRLTTDILFWGAILWSIWQRHNRLNYESNLISGFLGLFLLGVVISKAISLYWFESPLLYLFPFVTVASLALIASGFKGLQQYWRELFFSWFLFFPPALFRYFLKYQIQISLWTAKISTYCLYYAGFNVTNKSHTISLFLPGLEEFEAEVGYPCTGGPMILLMLRLALLISILIPLRRTIRFLLPFLSLGLGFIIGLIRVCILVLTLPKPARFDYWHGSEGSQIFSTIGIIVFSSFCYWIIQQQRSNNPHLLQADNTNE